MSTTIVLCGTFALFAFDCIVNECVVKRREARNPTQVRWFLCHAAGNFVIACLSVNGLVQFLKDPLTALVFDDGDSTRVFAAHSKWPLGIANAIHLYHLIGGFSLNAHDWFHHILFLPTLGVTGLIFDWGCFSNWLAFFICGLPGGVDYTILACQRMNLLTTLDQKRICCNMNMWLRMPGILFAMGVCYCNVVSGSFHAPPWALALQCIFHAVELHLLCKRICFELRVAFFSRRTRHARAGSRFSEYRCAVRVMH